MGWATIIKYWPSEGVGSPTGEAERDERPGEWARAYMEPDGRHWGRLGWAWLAGKGCMVKEGLEEEVHRLAVDTEEPSKGKEVALMGVG